ncbi:cyanoexosortase A [Aphanothece sacrum]|uniref:Exosortase n=1 Tax=Aphanothece sacrum FPU1 TaxID=1920663 RepID=A0A401IJT3_APHSA|nr:cyanoexosortase A [Aphanothece sacrum]GBF81371.1 exosortase [Aphanothece sacrum FPU1]
MTIDWRKSLQDPTSWVVALGIALAGLHLTIVDLSKELNLMSLSILAWLAIASMLWDKREDISFKSGVFSSFLGATLIVFMLLRSLSSSGYHLTFFPLVSGVAMALIASGIKQIKQYWKELVILTILAATPIFTSLLQLINLPTLTAKFSNASLWLLGFQSYREGIYLILPTGRVEVGEACSGIESILLMFFIAILFLFMIPLNRLQQIICVVLGVLLGFIINSIRVCILALLVAFSNKQSFDYWHGDDGSLIFALSSVFIFGIFCWLVYIRPMTLTSESEENIDIE